jgi:hypothetical protein
LENEAHQIVFYNHLHTRSSSGLYEAKRINLYTISEPAVVSFLANSLASASKESDILVWTDGYLVSLEFRKESGVPLAQAHIALNGWDIAYRESSQGLRDRTFVQNRAFCLYIFGLMEQHAAHVLTDHKEMLIEAFPRLQNVRAAYPWAVISPHLEWIIEMGNRAGASQKEGEGGESRESRNE